MKLLVAAIVIYWIVKYILGSDRFTLGGGGGGGATGTGSGWSAGDGETYAAYERPRDDYWAGSGTEPGERETHLRDLPREPGDERY